ncbi:MAG: RNA polymerase sigma factor [Isosphaeraceae bacterium]
MIRSSQYYPWPASSHWSEICAACRPDAPEHARAIETLCETFVGPVYSYVRRGAGTADLAKDLTQEFFVFLLGDSQPLSRYDRERGPFRPFLRTVLENFLKSKARGDRAVKRGGREVIISADWAALERLCPPAPGTTPDVEFDRNFANALLQRSIDELRREFARTRQRVPVEPLLTRLVGGKTCTYEDMAAELGMTPGAVRTASSRLLSRLREKVREEVARTLPVGGDVQQELSYLYESFFPPGPSSRP